MTHQTRPLVNTSSCITKNKYLELNLSVQDTISGSFLLATMSLNNEYNALHGHGLENDFSSLEKKNKEKNKMKKMYYKKKKKKDSWNTKSQQKSKEKPQPTSWLNIYQEPDTNVVVSLLVYCRNEVDSNL